MSQYVRKTQDLFISDKLRELLTIFHSESEVARRLLLKRVLCDDIIEDHVNFISISDSDPTKISYLTKDRSTKISESSDDNYWTTSKRFHCKPGALVQKLFKGISSKEVEKFSNLYKSFVMKKDLVFKIVSGNDIKQFYHQDSYQCESGSLGSSCMKYSKCQNFLELYTACDKVKLLILSKKDSKLIIGRALIWNFTQDSQDYKIMDRIYTIRDEDYSHFFKIWARDNNYLPKTNQNWGDTSHFDSQTTGSVEIKLSIKIDLFNLSKYPYLDTFKWLDAQSGFLFNYKPKYFTNNTNDYMLLSSADGQYNDCDSIKFDYIDRVWRNPSDLECYEYGKLTSQKNLNWSNIYETWILKNESIYESSIDDFIFVDESKNDQEMIVDRKNKLQDDLKKYSDLIFNSRNFSTPGGLIHSNYILSSI